MNRRFQNSACALAIASLALVGAAVAGEKSSAMAVGGEFQQKLRPMLEEHCFKCHNADKHKGGIDLTPFDSEGSVLKKYKLWERVIEAVRTEEMPPDDDKFTPQHGEVVVGGLKNILALLDSGHPSLTDPGPSLARRLSRLEYSYALRDLTGVELDFSALVGIPEDSTGSSLENVAAALNLPPSLLEKYFAAADLALTRLFGEADPLWDAKPDWERKPVEEKLKKVRVKFFNEVPEDADRAAAGKLVAQFAGLAWRRPLAPAESVEKVGALTIENGGEALLEGQTVPLAAGEELTLLPQIDGAFAGGDCKLKDFSISLGGKNASPANQGYKLPAAWEGKEKGSAAGNPIAADGQPIWRLDRLFPEDAIIAANYAPLIWDGTRWAAPDHTHAGHPSAQVENGKLSFAAMGPWNGGDLNFAKIPVLAFIAPRNGTYKVTGAASAKPWEGGAKTFPFALRKKDTQRAAEIKTIQLPRDGTPVPFEAEIELSTGHELLFVPMTQGLYNNAANFTLDGLSITRLP